MIDILESDNSHASDKFHSFLSQGIVEWNGRFDFSCKRDFERRSAKNGDLLKREASARDRRPAFEPDLFLGGRAWL